MKKLFIISYILGCLAVTVFFIIMVWNLTFKHIVDDHAEREKAIGIFKLKEAQAKAKLETTFQKDILDGEKRVKHYLGYRVLEEKKLKGHFHHIDFDFKSDKSNYCIECHSDLPHDKVKELRAFTNMHASFIGCQTCHLKLEKKDQKGVFKWYHRTTGEIVESPVRQGVQPGTYESKIIPFVSIDGKLQRIDTQDRIKFAREYREHEKTLTDLQKSKAKKIIHKIVNKKPHTCEDCHQVEAPALPFRDLGYSQKRINAFVGTEVVGMIKNYTKFYIPRILHPGFGEEAQEKESK